MLGGRGRLRVAPPLALWRAHARRDPGLRRRSRSHRLGGEGPWDPARLAVMARQTRRLSEASTSGCGSFWQDRSRDAFCHPVRGWAVAAPATKVDPFRCSSGHDAPSIQCGSTFAAGLVPQQGLPAKASTSTVGYRACTATSEALAGSSAPPTSAGSGRGWCGKLPQ
jgi:hypothetical protein